jgi:membrane fusion protein (multidrug efflux system)
VSTEDPTTRPSDDSTPSASPPAAEPRLPDPHAEAAAKPKGSGGPLEGTIRHDSLVVAFRVSTDGSVGPLPDPASPEPAQKGPPRGGPDDPKAAAAPPGDKPASGDGTAEKKPGDDKKEPAGPPWHQRPVLVGLIILAVIVVVVGVVLFVLHARHYVSSDDAYIDAIAERVSPQVSGRILRVLVGDNQDVTTGQVIVELDPADYQSRLDQVRAAQAQAEAQLAQAEAQREVLGAQLDQARASESTAQVNADNAARDLNRYRGLEADSAGAVSAQQLDRADAAALSTGANLKAAHAAVAAAQAQLVYVRSQITAARAGIGSAAAQAREAELTLSYTQIKARIDGRVANKNVTAGDTVAAGTPLMAIVPRDVYITANFKETQLDHMRPGQPVKIQIDAYPEIKLAGRVDSVQPGTGQAFSLLPAENATGNWVKVVQRVPVKIRLDRLPDDPGIRLAPGLSVEVTVTVR